MKESPLIVLESKSTRARILLGAVIIFTLLFVWFAVRWQVGNMLAQLTQPNQPDASEVAKLAIRLAPDDPRTRWLAARAEKGNFSLENIESTVRLFEEVVRRSPNDYRWWIELGRAYEQAEQPANAEMAFQRAVEVAPTYTFPHWQLGNFYLRQNRSEEAFSELRKATERSVVYREQVFSLAWDYFDKDPQKVEELAADTPDVRATLALFYAARGSADNALRVWNTLGEEDKAKHLDTAKRIAHGLFEKQRFRESLAFAVQTGIDAEAKAETISNGGFETFIGEHEDTIFGWRILRGEGKVDIAPDAGVKFQGARSLRVTFKGYAKSELHNVVQFIAVEPGARYRLSFMVRTDNLRSGGPPLVQVIGGRDNVGIVASEPFAVGSMDWTPVSMEFIAPPDLDSVHIRTGRLFCEQCPISGSIWYDDFALTKL